MELPFIQLPKIFLETPIAHRGFHNMQNSFPMGEGPENSREAVLAAITLGFAIEVDVHMSADYVPFVFHDYFLDRLSNTTGALRKKNSKTISKIKLANNESIPSLDEILSLVAGRSPLLIEIKDQDGFMGTNVGALESVLAEKLKNYKGFVAVMSFNPNSIFEFGKLLPRIPRGLVTDSFDQKHWKFLSKEKLRELASISSANKLRISFISHNYDKLNKDLLFLHNRLGRSVLTWTITNKTLAKKALRHADNITFEGFYPLF